MIDMPSTGEMPVTKVRYCAGLFNKPSHPERCWIPAHDRRSLYARREVGSYRVDAMLQFDSSETARDLIRPKG
jgi:hypothetical protein